MLLLSSLPETRKMMELLFIEQLLYTNKLVHLISHIHEFHFISCSQEPTHICAHLTDDETEAWVRKRIQIHN